MMDFESVIKCLHSDLPEIQVPAVEELASTFARGAEEAVAALERGPNRFLVAERLHWLGSVCIGPLKRLLQSTAEPEARTLASLVLLQLGSRDGATELFDAIRQGREYAGLAARHLAKNGIVEVAVLLAEQLDRSDLADADRDLSFVDALETMAHPLPPRFVERAQSESAPWQLRKWLGRRRGGG